MKIACQLCGVEGSVADAYLGRRVRCPKCGGMFVAQPVVESVDAGPQEPDESRPLEGEGQIHTAVVDLPPAIPAAAIADEAGAAEQPPAVPDRPAGEGRPAGEEAADPAGLEIGRLLGEAWRRTSGSKGAIWAGSAIFYLAVLVLMLFGAILLPTELQLKGTAAFLLNTGWQTAVQVVVMVFLAGLLQIGVRRAAGLPASWRLVFSALPQFWRIAVATVLQTVLISVGFLLLVLPGIYLSVGYALTLPLIVDRGLSPWQAMEASRKAIHRVWWRVAGLFLLAGLILTLSMLPLGLGLIWTWPMVILLAGVLYHRLFGTRPSAGPSAGDGDPSASPLS